MGAAVPGKKIELTPIDTVLVGAEGFMLAIDP
jgi:hypothetical protein